MTYEQAYKDHQRLWSEIGPASDMTGGYVDSDDLDKLLAKPTKATARDCLCRQIDFWFQNGSEDSPNAIAFEWQWMLEDYPWLQEIAERHGHA